MTWRDPPIAELRDMGHDARSLARDWITLWESEMAALAVDREAQETWRALIAAWAEAANALVRAAEPPAGDDRHRAWSAAPPRAAAADAASDAGDAAGGGADSGGLARRVAELERRLSDLERGAG